MLTKTELNLTAGKGAPGICRRKALSIRGIERREGKGALTANLQGPLQLKDP